MGLATLVAALHTRPVQPLPLLFAPALLFAGYVNVAGYAVDAAGMSAAWSGLYVLLSLRRRSGGGGGLLSRLGSLGRLGRLGRLGSSGPGLLARAWTPASQRTSTRRLQTPARRAVSALALGLGTVNCAAGAVTYTTGDRAAEAEARRERDRWGAETR